MENKFENGAQVAGQNGEIGFVKEDNEGKQVIQHGNGKQEQIQENTQQFLCD